jgi:serine protease Do
MSPGARAPATLLSIACLAWTAQGAAQVPKTVPTTTTVITTAPTAPAPQPAPPPVPPAPAPATPGAAPVALPAPPNTFEQARQGVVVIQRQGRPLALGVVLDGDGRILTALSALGNGNYLTARYADGAIVPLKLLHSDRGWDLALLAPTPPPNQAVRKLGVKAAQQPTFVDLQLFGVAPVGRPLTTAPVQVQLARPLLGGDGVTLSDAYTLSAKGPSLGAPILNTAGEVVALVARACPAGSAAGCTPLPYGAPVSALKRFLKKIPAEATWLGIEAAGEEAQGVRGVRVVSVTPGGPAARGGLRPGKDILQADLIVAVDGTPVATPDDLNEAVRARLVGDTVELLLFGLDRYRHVSVKPQPAPELTAPPYTAPIPTKPSIPNPYR